MAGKKVRAFAQQRHERPQCVDVRRRPRPGRRNHLHVRHVLGELHGRARLGGGGGLLRHRPKHAPDGPREPRGAHHAAHEGDHGRPLHGASRADGRDHGDRAEARAQGNRRRLPRAGRPLQGTEARHVRRRRGDVADELQVVRDRRRRHARHRRRRDLQARRRLRPRSTTPRLRKSTAR